MSLTLSKYFPNNNAFSHSIISYIACDITRESLIHAGGEGDRNYRARTGMLLSIENSVLTNSDSAIGS